MTKVIHPWPPVFDKYSRILIVGSLPSPASRKFGYYGHPQNIFWPTLAKVLDQPTPEPNQPARREFLLKNRIALWDAVHSCEIDGASDATIRDVVPNDFSEIFAAAQIEAVFGTGKTATELFNKFSAEKFGKEAIYLPSTSPANRFMQNKPEFWTAWEKVSQALNV